MTLDGVKCQQYFNARGSFYKSLVPIKSVRDMVSELRENYFLNKIMVGVHYRAFDPVNDWGKTLTWSKSKANLVWWNLYRK